MAGMHGMHVPGYGTGLPQHAAERGPSSASSMTCRESQQSVAGNWQYCVMTAGQWTASA
jgi:hypothetical protein